MATRISPPQNKTYYINPAYLTFVENSGYGANLIQVSASSSCYISVYDPANGIGYSDADRNYQRWKVTAYNNKFPSNEKFHIYVRLERSGTSALVIYDTVLRGVRGGEITVSKDENGNDVYTEAESTQDVYWYIKIGEVGDTDGTIIREITYDTGYLESDQGTADAGDLNEMWELNKFGTPWLIKAKQWLQSFTVKGFLTLVGGLVFKKGETEKVVSDIKRSTDSDEDVPVDDTTIPTTLYVENVLESYDDRFLRKDQDDRSTGTISSDKGFEVGNFESGTLGMGASMHMDEDGNTYVESDYLKIRKKATFTNITVQELKHIGGELILSPASMVCSRMEEVAEGYKCYFNQTDSDGHKVYNEFEVGDQGRCQTFNLEYNTYYWRLVTSIGDDFIVLSKTDCDTGSDIPKAGDNISQLGNRYDATRQAAVILSAYGEDAPSYKQYSGINSYSLVGKQVTKLSPNGNELTGVLNIEKGSKGWDNLEGLPDSIQEAVDLANKAQDTIDNTSIGAVNLLRNSGFTGDYQSEDVAAPEYLGSDSELYSRKLDKWDGDAKVYADNNAVSGYSVQLGSLSQAVKELIARETYVVSFKARGISVNVSCGDYSVSQKLTSGYARYYLKFEFSGSKVFSIEGDARICDLQLERGTIATDWNPSPYDNDKAYAEFQALKYLQDAIVNGNTSVLGGLILSSMIKLGNYKNGKMQKVNAGMSGIYNDDDDVAFWGGGTFEGAIETVMKFKSNPLYRPTESEWKRLANFVVTHGGDAVFRGSVFADNGFFRGEVHADSGVFKNVSSPNKAFKIDEEGNVEIVGTFITSMGGKRIKIDAESQSIIMYDELGRETVKMNYYSEVGELWTYGAVSLKRYIGNYSEVAMESFMSPSQVDIIDYITRYETHYRAGRLQMISLDGKGAELSIGLEKVYDSTEPDSDYKWLTDMRLMNIPTSADQVSEGGVYAELKYGENNEVVEKVLKIK